MMMGMVTTTMMNWQRTNPIIQLVKGVRDKMGYKIAIERGFGKNNVQGERGRESREREREREREENIV